MRTHETRQQAFVGYYATVDEHGALIEGKVTIRKPRLYETAEAATEAAKEMGTEAVELI